VTTIDLSEILRISAVHFPSLNGAKLEVEPLEKGGSDRKFYRIRAEGDRPIIFVQYGNQREENKHYVEIGSFLANAGVRVPKMYHHDIAGGRIWMEDLGETDLWTYRNQPWDQRRPLYEATLREVARLHSTESRLALCSQPLSLQPGFDERLYLWEQDYFFTHCLQGHFGLTEEVVSDSKPALQAIARELASIPRMLVHRDFQSQNVVILNGEPCLIDFQGMRPGLPQYDLASMLLDPYVNLSSDEQQHLLEFYQSIASNHASLTTPGAFGRIYDLCAAQRLMQALGAYGFLGHQRNRDDFLVHIPVALPRLHSVIARIPQLASLANMLERILELPPSPPTAQS
jgi:aminoglycoside/choline kinase family phosphotransferase